MEGSDKNLSHPGVWGQGYCYFRRDVGFPAKAGIHVRRDFVFPAKAGIYVTLTLRDSRLNSSPRATPEVAEAHSHQSIKNILPYGVPLRQLAGIRHWGGDVDSGFRRKDGRGCRNDGGEPERGEGRRNDGRGAGMTGGMTSSLLGRDDVAHLSERWATRSSSFVIPARNFRMTHVLAALRRL